MLSKYLQTFRDTVYRCCAWLWVLVLLWMVNAQADQASDPRKTVVVYAAASLTEALQQVKQVYMSSISDQTLTEAEERPEILLSFASSGTLARQIAQGAEADIFLSANPQWVDWLGKQPGIAFTARQPWLANQLVLIGNSGGSDNLSPRVLSPGGLNAFSAARYWCLGDSESVPAGIYAKQALQSLGWWESLRSKRVEADNVRSVLAFVQRGECDLGFVYASDAVIHQQVQVLGRIPDALHAPIRYPAVLLAGHSAGAVGFFEFLYSHPSMTVFRDSGFTTFPSPQ